MEYHYLDIRVCNGKIFLTTGDPTLFLDEYELVESFFLMTSGELVVESSLLNNIKALIINDCLISKIQNLELRDDLEVSYKAKDNLEFWTIKPRNEDKFEHITFWMNKHIVVSSKLLDELILNNGFKDSFLGSIYGKEFEVLTNRILIGPQIDTYFQYQFNKDIDFIEKMEKKSRDRYRSINGLPPLN